MSNIVYDSPDAKVCDELPSNVPAAVAAAADPIPAESDDNQMPWEVEDWVPTTKSGQQKTPNMIRGELQRYIDECKANGTSNQTLIIEKMGVNNKSFRNFMDPKNYKQQWSACSNSTYWAAAKLLAEVSHQKEQDKKNCKKRKSLGAKDSVTAKTIPALDDEAPPKKKSKAEMQSAAMDLIERISAVEGVTEGVVYDTCPQVVTKIKEFLQRDGMSKANLLRALGNINNNSLGRFLAGKKQDQCGNVTYRNAYIFFEKLRILEGKPKSDARKKNEMEHPDGFSLTKERPGYWIFPAF